MNTIIYKLIFTILLRIHVIHGVIVTGPETNVYTISWKDLKEEKPLKNLQPEVRSDDNQKERLTEEAAIARRFFMIMISSIRKQLDNDKQQDGDNREFVTKDLIDFNEVPVFVKGATVGDSALSIGLNDLIYSLRTGDETKETLKTNGIEKDSVNLGTALRNGEHTKKKEKLHDNHHINKEYNRKIPEIMEFLNSYPQSTDYIHSEVQRILRTEKVTGALRDMVAYLSKPHMDKLKESVFKCFRDKGKVDRPPADIWEHRHFNNLLIHIFKDPYND